MYFCHQHTSTHFVIEDAIFGRMDDIGDMFKKEVHEEFITNCLRHTSTNFFPEYSYLYVLVAHGPSNNDVPVGEKRWSEILNKEQNEFLENHHAFIIGWMLMTPEHPTDIHFIEYVDTRLKGYNITDCLIKKFENELAILNNHEGKNMLQGCFKIKPKCVLPKEIIQSSAEFWKKYFKKRFDIHTVYQLVKMKDNMKIDQNVRWYYLEKKIDEN
jgi:hypothetical protein